MHRFFLGLILLLCLPVLACAQEIRTNEKGEKIIVYQDGSWRYFNSSDDTLFGPDGSVFEQELIPTDEKEREAYLEEKEKDEAVLLANQASLTASRMEEAYNRVRLDRLAVEEEMAELRRLGSSVDPVALEDLEYDLELALDEEEKARTSLGLANDLAEMAEDMIEMNRKKRQKEMRKYEEGVAELFQYEPEPQEAFVEEAVSQDGVGPTAPSTQFAKYDSEFDTAINPPDPDCYLSYDGIDEFSGKKRRDTRMDVFFTSTRDELRQYLNGNEYIICRGQLTSLSGGLVFMTLEFTIASKSAQQSFGGLQKGSLLTIKFLNGESVRMQNSKTDFGVYNAADESFTFRAQYMVNANQERMLLTQEIDKVRVNWNAGYEDYEVFDLDFFRERMECLLNN